MKIYTRGGDGGNTQIYTHKATRVDKDDIILECYGTLDELNAQVGMLCSLLSQQKQEALEPLLSTNRAIQRALFQIGFGISDSSQIDAGQTVALENHIDHLQAMLPAQTHFILPGGCVMACHAHICRTVCRRCERVMVALSKQHDVDSKAIAYINRLSDYWFVQARYLNHLHDVADVPV
ncbi:cob(I)yrinic acid a,c-diamide adenosyltransferase [Alteromonas oceanisediminis]|uniref:cob(I)yrinic acid a,c-diamide adenosyltransferase n=1 Tax=Alteromonas oceanisediminis TaxID=2836180 RepID=UPI001BDAD34D|nr:cob(I)yrinic acid a,c-diamide adenosyltransferase [Alteromonas oceanisediminis]MBT0587266.1 cob(I)yrinic acid a,c-diamide adenosyltransferase [Alteromonas oceanisediminis]